LSATGRACGRSGSSV